jgi:hypothetical protein
MVTLVACWSMWSILFWLGLAALRVVPPGETLGGSSVPPAASSLAARMNWRGSAEEQTAEVSGGKGYERRPLDRGRYTGGRGRSRGRSGEGSAHLSAHREAYRAAMDLLVRGGEHARDLEELRAVDHVHLQVVHRARAPRPLQVRRAQDHILAWRRECRTVAFGAV